MEERGARMWKNPAISVDWQKTLGGMTARVRYDEAKPQNGIKTERGKAFAKK